MLYDVRSQYVNNSYHIRLDKLVCWVNLQRVTLVSSKPRCPILITVNNDQLLGSLSCVAAPHATLH